MGAGANNKTHASVVSQADLNRMKKEVLIKDKAQVQQERTVMNEQRQSQMAVAKQRKERMQAQDRERQANAPLEVKAKNYGENTLLSKIQDQMDEQYDDVKHMNQMLMASKVCTVRDRQLDENKMLEENWVLEQKRLDMMMEVERLKAIKGEMDREDRAHHARKRGAQVIIDQIQERQEIRMKIEETHELEKPQMLANIEKIRAEDEAKIAEKKTRVQVMNEEVKLANKNALAQKEAARQVEKKIDQDISEFNRKKIEREEAEMRAIARVKAEKEMEVQRLRDLQERANDRQAELDQVRAQKAFEQAELSIRA